MKQTELEENEKEGTLEVAALKPTPPEPISVEGVQYASIASLERKLGFARNVLSDRLKQGYTLKEALSLGKRINAVTYHGVTYDTLKDLAEAYGISESSLINRMIYVGSLEESIDYLVNRFITYEGEKYETLTKLCAERGISYEIVIKRIRCGKTLKQAIEKPVTEKAGYEIAYRGKTFKTKRKLFEHYGVSPTFGYRIARLHDFDLLDALELILSVLEPYTENRPLVIHRIPYAVVDGYWFNTLEETVTHIGIRKSQLQAFITRHQAKTGVHLTIAEALKELSESETQRFQDVSTGEYLTWDECPKRFKQNVPTLLKQGKVVKKVVPTYPTMKFNPETFFMPSLDYTAAVEALKARG